MSDMNGLGDADGLADVGAVDMFGLDEFGNPAGMHAMYGAAIGGVVGTATTIAARKYAKVGGTFDKHAEGIGALAGAAAGGVMMAFPATRGMGGVAIATALSTNGLRYLAEMVMKPADSAAKKQAGWGGVVIDPRAVIQPYQGLGIHAIEPGYAVNGLGAVAIDPAYPVPGSIHSGSGFGAARPELVGPPTLVGAGDYGMGENPAVTQTKLLGGPSVSSLGAHYGATLFHG